jgi:DNA invertase Pin-like site-specific DNA recombinase
VHLQYFYGPKKSKGERIVKERTKIAALYIRVSTALQSGDSQAIELKAYADKRGWEYQVYSDVQSGAKEKRPALENLLTDARRRRIDVIVIWSLDRLARSLKQLLVLLEEFQRLNLHFVCLKQDLDTSSASGRLTYHVLGAVAEFEREILRARVQMGMAEAKRRGRPIGRPSLRRFSQKEIEDICRLKKEENASIRKLAAKYGATQFMVNKVLNGEYPGA